MQPDEDRMLVMVGLIHLALRLAGNDPVAKAVLISTFVTEAKKMEGNATPVEAETTIQ